MILMQLTGYKQYVLWTWFSNDINIRQNEERIRIMIGVHLTEIAKQDNIKCE